MTKDSIPNPWTTLNKTERYTNPWISVSHREVISPKGAAGIYGVVQFKNLAIGIIPLDEEYNTWIVGQYRYTLEQYSWEIPEGGGPLHEAPLAAAQRELQEETGISASHWTPILELSTSNSVTDEWGICYVAQGLTFGEAQPEDTEDLQVRKLPFSELVNMAMRGEIHDAISLAAIFKLKLLMDEGKI